MHAFCLLDVIYSGFPSKPYCFAIPRFFSFKWGYHPKDNTILLLMILWTPWRGYCSHTHTHTHKHFVNRKLWDRYYNLLNNWNLLSPSVLMGYQNSSSIVGQQLKISTRKSLKNKIADWIIKLILILEKLNFFTKTDEEILFVYSYPTKNYNDIFNKI